MWQDFASEKNNPATKQTIKPNQGEAEIKKKGQMTQKRYQKLSRERRVSMGGQILVVSKPKLEEERTTEGKGEERYPGTETV